MDCNILDSKARNAIKQSLHISALPNIHVCKRENNVLILRAKYSDEVELQSLFNAWDATWRVARTFPKDMSAGIKNLFYKEYHCQHSDLRVLSDQFMPHEKHCGCPAKLTITIKKIGKRCRAKDPHLPKYPTIIKVFNEHNHTLHTADILKFKDVSLETKNKFLKLFESGHSPYSALEFHRMDLQNNYGDEYYLKAADRSICPDLNWCYKLFHEIRGKLYGHFSQDCTKVMVEKLSTLQAEHVSSLKYVIDDGKPIVAVMTPLMKRVHQKINHSAEVVFMDSTGGFDSLQHRVFVLMTHSYMGALPLGIVITTTEKAESVAKGLQLLLSLISPTDVFYGQKTPKIVLTDNSASGRLALRSVFPKATQLLCIFHILQGVWRFVWKAENKIAAPDKNDLFNMFKKLLYAKTEADLNSYYQFLLNSLVAKKYPKVLKHYADLWNQRKDWALCYRSNLLTRQNNTNNYAESTMRILKDKIFHRTRAYNIIQLLDFLVTKIDPYYQRKLLDFAAGRNVQAHLQARYSLNVLNKKAETFEIKKHDENDIPFFTVKNTTKQTEYEVNLELEMCTCFVGRTGGPCKHQAAVLRETNSNTSNFFIGDEKQRRFIHELATGVTVSSDFYSKFLKSSSETVPVEVTPLIGRNQITEEAPQSETVQNNVPPLVTQIQTTEEATQSETVQNNVPSAVNRIQITDEEMDVDIGISNVLKTSTTKENPKMAYVLSDITNQTASASTTMPKKVDHINAFQVELKTFCETLKKISKSEDGMISCRKFFKNFSHIKTDASLCRALCMFGKENGCVKPRLNSSKIGVQPTSKCRRMRTLGGNAPIAKGRPPKKMELKENVNAIPHHSYLRTSRKTKAPHCLSFCVQENLNLPAS